MADDQPATFNPQPYIVTLRGKDYLEVKWRLLWLRTTHPGAHVDTALVSHDAERRVAVFHATVTLPGGAAGSGWGRCSAKDFPEYVEKAETKALGRALATVGFGTQFAEEWTVETVDPATGEIATQAPVSRAPAGIGPGPLAAAARAPQEPQDAATGLSKVGAALLEVAALNGLDEPFVQTCATALYGRPVAALDRQQLTAFAALVHQPARLHDALAAGGDPARTAARNDPPVVAPTADHVISSAGEALPVLLVDGVRAVATQHPEQGLIYRTLAVCDAHHARFEARVQHGRVTTWQHVVDDGGAICVRPFTPEMDGGGDQRPA